MRRWCEFTARTTPREQSIGSGTLVTWNGRLVVLTARHVVEEPSKIIVELCTRRTHWAKVLKCDAVWDCAVLELIGRRKASSRPRSNWATGHAAPRRSAGIVRLRPRRPPGLQSRPVSRLPAIGRSAPRPGRLAEISGHARQGDSGGPDLRRRGRLVGVLWGTDGEEVVGVQAGRLHVLLDAAVPDDARCAASSRVSLRRAPHRTPTPAKPSGANGECAAARTGRSRNALTAVRRASAAGPNVIVQSDPDCAAPWRTSMAKSACSSTTAAGAGRRTSDDEPSPLVAGLCMIGAVAAGFVIYFAAQKGH